MAKVTGTVVRTNEKQFGNRTLYSVLVDSNGSETWYGLGRDAPTCSEGDSIEFEAVQKGKYWNVAEGSLTVLSSAPKAPSGGGSNGNARESYWQDKHERDLINDNRYNNRAAHMFAKDVVMGLVASGDLELPKTKGKALEAVLGYIDMVAADYHMRWMDTEDPMDPSPAEAEAEEPEFDNG